MKDGADSKILGAIASLFSQGYESLLEHKIAELLEDETHDGNNK